MVKGGAATVLAVLAAATLLCLRDPAAAALPRLEHPAKNDESPSLLVVRDWGRKGECNQYQVAEQVNLSRAPASSHV
jgi:tartrate-resistant acid phosphatase type 5